jgi:hypothetical protein
VTVPIGRQERFQSRGRSSASPQDPSRGHAPSFESYVQGDYGPALDALDPDVELWLDPQAFLESGPFRGRQAVVARLAEVVSSFDDYWASAEGAELIGAASRIVTCPLRPRRPHPAFRATTRSTIPHFSRRTLSVSNPTSVR